MTTIDAVVAFGETKGACREAMQWLTTQGDPQVAWETCERPDWMIWYAGRRGIDRRVLVRIVCDCARTALRFVPEGENRPRLCIEATERWIEGAATIEEVRTARRGAYAAAATADAAADAAYAADAATADAAATAATAADAAYAAYAAAAAADAAAAAADAATAAYADAAAATATDATAAATAADAAAATDATAAADARKQANIHMCEIVRKHIAYADVAL